MSILSSAMVMYMLMATITQYATEFGSTAMVAGLVSGIYVVGGMFSRLAAGRWLETRGWKQVGLAAAALHFVACCFYPFVSGMPMLILVRFIHGLGFGASSTAIMTIGMSVLPKSRFGEAAGYLMLGTTISVGLGPFIGGYVYDTFGAMGCFLCAIVISFLMGIFLFFVDLTGVETGQGANLPKDEGDSLLSKFIEPGSVPISMVTSLCGLGYVGVMSFYRIYAEQVDLVEAFSWFFLLYAALLVVSRPMAGKIQDRYGARYVCIPGITAQTVGLILLAVKPCVFTLILCALGCALGYGALSSACNVMACQAAPLSRRSYAVTTFYLCCDGAMGFGPALLGAVATAAGSYHVMYLAAAGMTLLALPLFLVIDRRRKQAEG
ncbi:MAG: MFS transporter [Ruminiclostridium sp.]|nr:MFS transporter [Ruminiclostridium sp.]